MKLIGSTPSTNMAPSFLSKLKSSSASNSSQYITIPARYGLEVKKLVYNPDANNGAIFAAEMEIVEAEATDAKPMRLVAAIPGAPATATTPATPAVEAHLEYYDGGAPHKVGENRSWVVRLDQKSAAGNVLSFLMAVSGLTEAQVKDVVEVDDGKGGKKSMEFWDYAISDMQPFAGKVVIADVFVKPQKGDKLKPFTNFKWMGLPAVQAVSPTPKTETEPQQA